MKDLVCGLSPAQANWGSPSSSVTDLLGGLGCTLASGANDGQTLWSRGFPALTYTGLHSILWVGFQEFLVVKKMKKKNPYIFISELGVLLICISLGNRISAECPQLPTVLCCKEEVWERVCHFSHSHPGSQMIVWDFSCYYSPFRGEWWRKESLYRVRRNWNILGLAQIKQPVYLPLTSPKVNLVPEARAEGLKAHFSAYWAFPAPHSLKVWTQVTWKFRKWPL